MNSVTKQLSKATRKKRLQKGQIILRSDRFYSRYYQEDGSMKAEWICDKDQVHYSANCKAVKLLHQAVMLRVNSARDIEDKGASLTLSEYWTGTFSPAIYKRHRKSTADSYENLWQKHISPGLGFMKMSDIETQHVQQLLTKLANEGYGLNTMKHCKSTVSAVMTHALNFGLIKTNPVRGASPQETKPKAPGVTSFYTQEEIIKTVEALEGMHDCQVAVGLSFWCGLRTSEIQAIRWADISLEREVLTVNIAQVRRTIGELKTPESHADLPIGSSLLMLLKTWREKSPVENVYVFQNGRGTPDDLREMVRRRIKPRLAEKKILWKSWYAGRRGLGTLLARLRGPLAASQALRHRTMAVSMSNYIRQDKRELAIAMKLLEDHKEED